MPGLPPTEQALRAEIEQLRQRVRVLEQAQPNHIENSFNLNEHKPVNPLLESMQEGYAYCQMIYDDQQNPVDFIYLYVNSAFERLTGLANVIGKQVSQVIPGLRDQTPELLEIYNQAARDGKPSSFEINFSPLDIWLSIHVYSTHKGYFVAVFENITEKKRAEVERSTSEINLLALIENTDGSIWSIDRNYRLIIGNKLYHANVAAALGRRIQNGESVLQPSFSRASLEEWRSLYDRALRGESFEIQTLTRFRHAPEWVEYRFSPIRTADGEITGVTVFGRIIQAQKDVEHALRVSLEKYRVLFESFPLGISITGPGGEIIETNQQAILLLGISRNEHTSRSFDSPAWQIVRTDLTPMPAEEFASVRAMRENRLVANVEMGILKEKGEITWLSVNAAPIPLEGFGVAITYGDISERKQAQEALAASLAEKEALLRELYHRTKNNMQVICAMLSMQSLERESVEVKTVFQDMINRINSMALVHQKLYETKNLTRINLHDYVYELVGLLVDSYRVNIEKIRLNLEIDSIDVAIDTAIPIGMILTELISNVFKHGFPKDLGGDVHVILQAEPGGWIVLEVSDTGVGFLPNFDPKKQGKMGLQSILAIGRMQLDGEVEFGQKPGVFCRIKFRE